MNRNSRWHGTRDYIYAHWPAYFVAYLGLMLSLTLIGVGAELGWLALVPLGLALFITIGYFMGTSIWAAYQLYHRNGLQPHQALFELGQLQPTDRLVYIHLGLRNRAVELGQRFTSGQIVVIDVYSPQWAPGRHLIRWRTRMPFAFSDPRYEWCNGEIGLLPLPDRSVKAVMLCQVLSQLWQQGDQLRLLREVQRVLVPDGQILVSERARSQMNGLVMGPAVLSLPTAEGWRSLLKQAGFREQQARELNGLIHCFRARKPTPIEAVQLSLELVMP